MLSLAAMMTACGNSAETEVNQNGIVTATSVYTGPAPATTDVQAFKLNFWDNLVATNRCGSCHNEGGQSPTFVNENDVNKAYSEAIKVVDLMDPAASAVVTKVALGHNCWEAVDSVCAGYIQSKIEDWVGVTADDSGRAIELVAPAIKEPGASKRFPVTAQDNDPNSFEQTVYPLLTSHCASCHADNSATPQAPFFANSDVTTAYEAAKVKMDLETPSNSRLVLRLRDEFHNCWSADCQTDAIDMQTEIEQFAGAVSVTAVDPSLITSKALLLEDAIVASGGDRQEDNVIALWEFKTGSGNTAYDTSGIEPALNLTFSGTIPVPVDWVLGYGIEFKEPTARAQGSTTASKKLHDFIKASGEYSIESWVIPGNVTQEEARIISYSGGSTSRNFTMRQSLYNYEFQNRTDLTDADGSPMLATADADEDLQSTLQHVVMTFDPTNGRRVYVNGVFTDDVDDVSVQGGSLASWDDSYAFVLGNEVSGQNPWSGKLRLVAVHNRALSDAQIMQNYSVGVGQKYYMLFSVADRIGIPDSYILFEMEQFDNTAYLFNQPRFINLDPDWVPTSDIVIKGMRIAVNGKESIAGQAFANLDVTVNATDYTADGQVLSDMGTVIALEKSPDTDEFFLTFEQLDADTNPYVDADPVAPTAPADAEKVSDIGIRTFEEINATLSAITGIPVTNPTVNGLYTSYQQQLPTVEDVNTFLPSHQMAIAQLAMTYCSELVNNDKSYFTDPATGVPFDFTQTAGVAFDTVGKAQVLNPLLAAVMNIDVPTSVQNLSTQPAETSIKDALSADVALDLDANLSGDSYNSLMDCMSRCATGAGATKCDIYTDGDPVTPDNICSAADNSAQNTVVRTEEIVKATCAAALGSAIMLVQ